MIHAADIHKMVVKCNKCTQFDEMFLSLIFYQIPLIVHVHLIKYALKKE